MSQAVKYNYHNVIISHHSSVQELVRLTARFYGIESVRVQNGVMGLSDYLVLGERGVVSKNIHGCSIKC